MVNLTSETAREKALDIIADIVEIGEIGSEIYLERSAYSPTEYKKAQYDIDVRTGKHFELLHDLYIDCMIQGIYPARDIVGMLEDTLTKDCDGRDNHNVGRCIVCGADMHNGVHGLTMAQQSDAIAYDINNNLEGWFGKIKK